MSAVGQLHIMCCSLERSTYINLKVFVQTQTTTTVSSPVTLSPRNNISSPEILLYTVMKFEDLLMHRDDEHQKRLDLIEEVAELQEVLKNEQKLNHILQCALHGLDVCHACLSPILRDKRDDEHQKRLDLIEEVQVLLAEIAMVEEEIIFLEREVEYLNLSLYQGRKHKKEWNLQQKQHQQLGNRHHPRFLCQLGRGKEISMDELLLPNTEMNSYIHVNGRNTSLEFISETRSTTCRKINNEAAEISRRNRAQNKNICLLGDEVNTHSQNKLSEELLKNMISIFHKLNKKVTQANCESDIFPKLSCINSRSSIRKSSINCKTSICSSNYSIQMLDPFDRSPDSDGTSMDMVSYENFVHFTRSSLDMSRISLCHPAIITLRVLMDKLSTVELSSMTYKQKLAFWINIYNACIMHAFLLHGLPPSADKPLILLNKAAVNVGGIVLNALAIEHYILRPARTTQNIFTDRREVLLRHAYGLGYPEPNVTFALCRGSWSSPALRVYTTENVVNELEKAKLEYLEASVRVTTKKKIVMPRLLHKHMQDFADDIESLLEWIYSQLPRSGSLKGSILGCLRRDRKVPLSKLVEIQPDDDEFRYLLPSISRPLMDAR